MIKKVIKPVLIKAILTILSIAFSSPLFPQEANGDLMHFIHYTHEDGLPYSYVKSITQDQYNFIWIATRNKIYRFDGHNFQDFPAFNVEGKEISLSSNRLFTWQDTLLITQSTTGQYYSFDFKNEEFKTYLPLYDPDIILQAEPTDFDELIYLKNGKLFSVNPFTGKVNTFPDSYGTESRFQDILFVMLEERENKIFTVSNTRNLVVYNRELEIEKLIELTKIKYGISTLFIDSKNKVWLGTYSEGVFEVDLETGELTNYSKLSNEKGIVHNMIHCINEDYLGRIWIGTEGGLSIWNPESKEISNYKSEISVPDGLNSDPIYTIFRDNSENMWLGTYFGGINFWSSQEKFFNTWHSGIDKKHLDGNVVSCFEEDTNGNIWIGMEDKGLNVYDKTTASFKHYSDNSENARLSYNNVHDLMFETDERLWIATYTGGITILNIKTDKTEYINSRTIPILPSDNVFTFFKLEDSIFIGTSDGISVYDIQKKTIRLFNQSTCGGRQIESICKSEKGIWFSSRYELFFYSFKKDTLSRFDKIPSMKSINFVKTDSKGRIWIGDTSAGLCLYEEDSGNLIFFNKENGFPSSGIMALCEGEDEWYWASSDIGLIKFNPVTRKSFVYGRASGIFFNEFNFRASFKDRNGNIYFGGNEGMVSFNENTTTVERPLDLKFTELILFNERVRPGKKSPLDKPLYMKSEIILNHKQSVFSIGFSAFNYEEEGKCQYAYYLENLETSWNYVGNRPFANYNSLRPGKYILHVAAISDSPNSVSETISLVVRVKPHFLLSFWAYIVYLVLFSVILFIIFSVISSIHKSKAQIEIQKREKIQLEALNRSKLEFFTNISHEIKTPLSLIIAPLQTLIEEENISPFIKQKLKGISHSAKHLLQLVNQLMDFRKIASGKEKLKVSSYSDLFFMQKLKEAFLPLSENRQVDFQIKSDFNGEEIWFDMSIILKILFNLISNAFKFTPENGSIILSARIKASENGDAYLLLNVKDTGIGIAHENHSRIFERFYQISNNKSKEAGSGIGLAYVRSLVELHKGNIELKSEVNKGSEFLISIPVSKNFYSGEEINDTPEFILPSFEPAFKPKKSELPSPDKLSLLSDKPTILVIDDNLELLAFISESLKEEYKVFTAENGRQGLIKISEILPDIIISDVMMPEMDGIELVKIVKNNIETSHIPIILLTAKTDTENKFEGYNAGADIYIEKPFYMEMLKQNISNILNTRLNLIRMYKKNSEIEPIQITNNEKDREFIRKFTEIVFKNIDKQDLDVSFMVKQMAVSRTLIHLKIKSLAGISTTAFINSIRFREAIKLISEGKCNISEASYRTGFTSPTYFSTSFKKHFGKTPTEYFNL